VIHKQEQKIVIFIAAFVVMLATLCATVNAMQFNLGKDTNIDCDVTITYGAGFRTSDRDDAKLADINTDDGNRNFDQWDMINNKITLLADLDMRHKNFGAFVRPKAFYDHVYMSDNANDSPETNNALAGGLIDSSDEWADDVEDRHGNDAEILDLYAYATFDVGKRQLDLRVGKQVISWGESLFVTGGISAAQSPVDLSAAVAVGTEVKEILLPTETVYTQVDLTDKLALGGYYQWKWEKSRLMEGGTFFASQSDFLDDLGAPILVDIPGVGLVPALQRGEDHEADDNGQFGVSLTYASNWLNNIEFGLYYINYHDKLPLVNVDMASGTYFTSYTEDIKLYGASFSSLIGDVNVSGEFSYRQDYGFDPTTTDDYWQAQTSWIYTTSFMPFSDAITTIGEIACAQMSGLNDDELDLLEMDDFAWRYVLQVGFDWYEVLPKLDTSLVLNYGDQPNGTNALGTEGVGSVSAGLSFIYKQVYEFDITYEERLDRKDNPDSDRDTLSLTLSYTF
jgi:hypothetical protein